MKQVDMIALRKFPLGTESRRVVAKGSPYTISEKEVSFHEDTGRGRRANPEKTPAKSGKVKGD